MKKMLIAMVATLCFAAHSQVVIYRQTITATRTGNGQTVRSSLNGFVVLDTQSAKCTQINVTNSRKAFREKKWDDYEAAYTVGAQEKESYSVFRQSAYADANGDTRMETDVLTGQATTLAIGAGAPFLYPKVMQVASRAWFYTNAKPCLEEASGKLIFDQKETKAANLARESVSECVARLTALLRAQGYTQEE